MRTLEQIFQNVPAGCTEIRLSMRVYFGDNSSALTGWLYVGDVWQNIPARADQPAVTETELSSVQNAYGWNMPAQPSRKNSMEFIYTFKPDAGGHRFQVHSKSVQYVERRRQARVFEVLEAF